MHEAQLGVEHVPLIPLKKKLPTKKIFGVYYNGLLVALASNWCAHVCVCAQRRLISLHELAIGTLFRVLRVGDQLVGRG